MLSLIAILLPVSNAFATISNESNPHTEKLCREGWCYQVETIEGWAVYFSQELVSSDKFEPVRKRLLADLGHVKVIVPQSKLARLQGTTIYMSLVDPSGNYGLGVYHHSRELLIKRGHDPDKVYGIEIANAKNYLRTETSMPAAVLHELGHSYRKRFLSDPSMDSRLQSIYESAMKSGIYEDVSYFDGEKTIHKKAYAATDRSEYFCESVEAYFWRNDFFPFDREDLRKHDPRMFEFMQEIWTKD